MAEKKKRNRVLRFIISSVLSFVLALLLTAVTILSGIYVGFLNENRILDALNYKDYYSSVEASFYKNAIDISIPIGLPGIVMDNVVDSETVYEDIRGYVIAAVKGEEYTFHTDGLKQKLTDNVYHYYEIEGLQLTGEQVETIPKYVQTIADEYENNVKIPLIHHFAGIKEVYGKILIVAMLTVLLLGGVLIFMNIRMYRWKHRGLRFVVYSTLAAAYMVVIPSIAVLASGYYKKINIGSEYVYYAFVRFIGNGLKIFIYMGIGWLIVSAGILLLIYSLKKND